MQLAFIGTLPEQTRALPEIEQAEIMLIGLADIMQSTPSLQGIGLNMREDKFVKGPTIHFRAKAVCRVFLQVPMKMGTVQNLLEVVKLATGRRLACAPLFGV